MTPSTPSLKTQLEQLAVKDLQATIEQLLATLTDTSPNHSTALHLLGQYHQLKREQIKKTLSSEEEGLRFRQLLDSLLQLIDQITDADRVGEDKAATTYYVDQKVEPIALDLAALEQEGRRRQAELIIKKLNRLREALLLATDVSVQFKYEHEIEQLEAQLRELKGD